MKTFGHQLIENRSAAGTPLELISNRNADLPPNRTEPTMDDLPELPFEKVLSYLSLEDVIKARAVSRSWYHKINSFRVKSLCFSNRPRGFIFEKNRWISGAFAKNFISSTRFASFFDTFSQTILSSLKHLRLCDLHLSEEDRTAFARTLNSFDQLEQLDIIRVEIIWAELNRQDVFHLNLPMLTSLHLEDVLGIKKLTVEASSLREVKFLDPYYSRLRLEIVHGESVERLLVDRWEYTEVKNLQFLYAYDLLQGDLTFLQQLKEIHLQSDTNVSALFRQKQQLGRADLKIYLCGLLLNGPDDPVMSSFRDSGSYYLGVQSFVSLAKNPSRLADEIPFYSLLYYSDIEAVAPEMEVDLLKRFTNLNTVLIGSSVRDIERFLVLLKNFENIVVLDFDGDEPQGLFDRLPEHCAVQKLTIYNAPSDLAFLFRLKHLIHLLVGWSVGSEIVRRAFEELHLLSTFEFPYGQEIASIEINPSKEFMVYAEDKLKTTVSDLNAAIELIFGNKPSRGTEEAQGQ